jgi:hypothetical protein
MENKNPDQTDMFSAEMLVANGNGVQVTPGYVADKPPEQTEEDRLFDQFDKQGGSNSAEITDKVDILTGHSDRVHARKKRHERYDNLDKMAGYIGFEKAKTYDINHLGIEPGSPSDRTILERDNATAKAIGFGKKACAACSFQDTCQFNLEDQLRRMLKPRREKFRKLVKTLDYTQNDVECRTIVKDTTKKSRNPIG